MASLQKKFPFVEIFAVDSGWVPNVLGYFFRSCISSNSCNLHTVYMVFIFYHSFKYKWSFTEKKIGHTIRFYNLYFKANSQNIRKSSILLQLVLQTLKKSKCFVWAIVCRIDLCITFIYLYVCQLFKNNKNDNKW